MSRADSASKTKLITLRPASNFSRSSCSTRSLSVTESRSDFTRLSALSRSAMAVRTSRVDAKLQLLARQARFLQLGLRRLNLALAPAAIEERERDVYANAPNRWRRFPERANWRRDRRQQLADQLREADRAVRTILDGRSAQVDSRPGGLAGGFLSPFARRGSHDPARGCPACQLLPGAVIHFPVPAAGGSSEDAGV